jgi:hypothetical protein
MNDTEMSVTYIGVCSRGFQWSIEIYNYKFDYFTGFGHITKERTKFKLDAPYNDLEINAQVLNAIGAVDKRRYLSVGRSAFRELAPDKQFYIKEPELMGVLYALHSDAQLGEELFKDFCDNLDFETDSREALETYLKCQETAYKMRGFQWPEQILNGEY